MSPRRQVQRALRGPALCSGGRRTKPPLSIRLFASLFCFALPVLALQTGCNRPVSNTPQGAVRAYIGAVQGGHLESAYKMLSTETRAGISFEDFQRLVTESPQEVEELLNALDKETQPPLVTAEIKTKEGETLLLTYEHGAWRIDESAVNFYSQSSPRSALLSFVRAYDRKRYDVLLRFVPEGQNEGVTQAVLKNSWEGEEQLEMEQIVEGLRPSIASATIELLGDRATMSYGPGGIVELVREHGLWKIEDFQ